MGNGEDKLMAKMHKQDALHFRRLVLYDLIITVVLFVFLMGGSHVFTACDSRGLPVEELPELPENIAARVKRLPGPTEYRFLYLFSDGDLMVTTEEGYLQVFTAEGKKKALLCADYDALCVKNEDIVLKKNDHVAVYTKEGMRIGEPVPNDHSYKFETSLLRIDRGRTYRVFRDRIEVTENGVADSLLVKRRPFIAARTIWRIILIPAVIISGIIGCIFRLNYRTSDLWQ